MRPKIESESGPEINPGIEPSIESPCTGVCQLNDNLVCLGCLRTIDQIIAWPAADGNARLAILGDIAKRRGEIKT